jgi:hypothetical protein
MRIFVLLTLLALNQAGAVEHDFRSRFAHDPTGSAARSEMFESAFRQFILNRLDQFLNIDDMAILRPRNLTDEQKRRYLIRAFSQVGKQYDFNFDVETHREIVCSELAFVVFPDFEWPVEMSVGRYTVSPDHIARLAVGDDPKLSPVLLIHDGRKLPVASNRHNLTVLLQELYDQIQY